MCVCVCANLVLLWYTSDYINVYYISCDINESSIFSQRFELGFELLMLNDFLLVGGLNPPSMFRWISNTRHLVFVIVFKGVEIYIGLADLIWIINVVMW